MLFSATDPKYRCKYVSNSNVGGESEFPPYSAFTVLAVAWSPTADNPHTPHVIEAALDNYTVPDTVATSHRVLVGPNSVYFLTR